MIRVQRASAAVLWLAAGPLLWLGISRPFVDGHRHAAGLPTEVGAFHRTVDFAMTPREHELLGTDDAVWRTYVDAAGAETYVVALFHQSNWKSVHPPHLCLRGSDMEIVEDGLGEPIELAAGGSFRPGRLVCTARGQAGRRYLSLFAFGARDLHTGSYAGFVWHHLPRALLRASHDGYLLRVEAWLDHDGAEPRCRELLRQLVAASDRILAD